MAKKRIDKAKGQSGSVSGSPETAKTNRPRADVQQDDERTDFGILPRRDLKKNLGCG